MKYKNDNTAQAASDSVTAKSHSSVVSCKCNEGERAQKLFQILLKRFIERLTSRLPCRVRGNILTVEHKDHNSLQYSNKAILIVISECMSIRFLMKINDENTSVAP